MLSRFFMLKLNQAVGSWDLRRVPPQLTLNATHWNGDPNDGYQRTEFSPYMQYTARLDPKF
jgi:hypothetical protein